MPIGTPPPRASKIPSTEGDVNTHNQKTSTAPNKRSLSGRKDQTHQPASDVGRRPTVIVRRRLPWLDGPQQSRPGHVPGYFESKESLGNFGDAAHNPPHVPEKERSQPSTAPASSFGKDPALRAVGSTPSLRKRARSGDFKSLSLSSQPRPGIKPVTSKKDAKRALGMVDEQRQDAMYTSSEYSANISSDKDSLSSTRPQNDPSFISEVGTTADLNTSKVTRAFSRCKPLAPEST